MPNRTRVKPATVAFRAPRPTRNEVPWVPPFQYRCSRGHTIHADVECCHYPACSHGQSCDGELTRVGPGSKGPRT